MWKEAVVVECELLCCHLHAVSGVTGTKEHAGYLACGLRFVPGPIGSQGAVLTGPSGAVRSV